MTDRKTGQTAHEWREEMELALAQLAHGLRHCQHWIPEANGQDTLARVITRAQARHEGKEAALETRPAAQAPEMRVA